MNLMNQCVRKDNGVPKVKYTTYEEANSVAKKLKEHQKSVGEKHHVNPFKCTHCGAYHIGKSIPVDISNMMIGEEVEAYGERCTIVDIIKQRDGTYVVNVQLENSRKFFPIRSVRRIVGVEP